MAEWMIELEDRQAARQDPETRKVDDALASHEAAVAQLN